MRVKGLCRLLDGRNQPLLYIFNYSGLTRRVLISFVLKILHSVFSGIYKLTDLLDFKTCSLLPIIKP